MRIEVFNVEHGQCSMIHCPNGRKIMIDAGHNSSTNWRPSTHFRGQHIDVLVISNFDEDHTSDLPALHHQVGTILINHSVSSAALKSLKRDGMGQGIATIHRLMHDTEIGVLARPSAPDIGVVNLISFWNSYPSFTDANNLSRATFISCFGFTILFPGDLEIAGWRELLKNNDFAERLQKVSVLVASHHGRDNGCCEEIFNYCRPRAVIISDGGKEFATQETVDWYRARTEGCKTTTGEERRVFSTRKDGKIDIQVLQDGWNIETGL